MTIRQLNANEWDRLIPLFRSLYGELPPPTQLATVVVAEDDQRQIVGFFAAQLLLHAEPLWIDEKHKKSLLIPRLIGEMQKLLPNLPYCFSSTKNAKVARLLKRLGFVEMPWTTFRWLRRKEGV